MKNNPEDYPSRERAFKKPAFKKHGDKKNFGKPSKHTSDSRGSFNRKQKEKEKTTAWSDGAKWYNEQLGEKGSYYHEKLLIPNALAMLNLKTDSEETILDVGCGQGVFARHLPKKTTYLGIDLSAELLSHAEKYEYPCRVDFLRCDATKYSSKLNCYSLLVSMLSLQNMEHPDKVVANLSKYLKVNGRWLVILNHPYFRIPRHSSWDIDKETNIQYRRLDQYMTPEAVSMQIHPSMKEKSPLTWNFHHPLSEILSWFFKMNFVLVGMEEWCSDKKSTGMHAGREDKSRKEFPLFMALLLEKQS